MPIKPESELRPEVKAVITRKRKKFARLMATGQYTQQQAYETAFNTRGGSPEAHMKNGHKIAHLPEVKALIEQLEEETLPIGDIRNEQEQALMHLKALAFNALDEKTRVTATVHLYHLLETHRETEERIKMRRSQVTHSIPVDAVVSELLQIADSQQPIELVRENSNDPAELEIRPAGESE
jgi:hypothetical protein